MPRSTASGVTTPLYGLLTRFYTHSNRNSDFSSGTVSCIRGTYFALSPPSIPVRTGDVTQKTRNSEHIAAGSVQAVKTGAED